MEPRKWDYTSDAKADLKKIKKYGFDKHPSALQKPKKSFIHTTRNYWAGPKTSW
jgi:hypothetical protein